MSESVRTTKVSCPPAIFLYIYGEMQQGVVETLRRITITKYTLSDVMLVLNEDIGCSLD